MPNCRAMQAHREYFLHLIRTEFPSIWAAVVAGTGDTVVCVPQASLRKGYSGGSIKAYFEDQCVFSSLRFGQR